jgi:hypothetical protein
MTIPQLLAFDDARRDRRKAELEDMMHAVRVAHHADDKDFERITRQLSGEKDPDTFDFDEM